MIENKFLGCSKIEIEQALKNAKNFNTLYLNYETIFEANYRIIRDEADILSHFGDSGKGESQEHKVKLIKESCHLSVFQVKDKLYPIVNLVIKPDCKDLNFLCCITPFGMFVADGFTMLGPEILYDKWAEIYMQACKKTGSLRDYMDYKDILKRQGKNIQKDEDEFIK
ncbi:MAG: hypothetical protein IJZ26_01820 [Clostridia bacterium]|nr:hypothetical protein [Clostridia bacterium]